MNVQFLNENDTQVVRLGSEIMFLQQLVEALKKDNQDIIDNLRSMTSAKEHQDKYVNELELQADRMKEQLQAHAYYEQKEKENDGSGEVLRQSAAQAQSHNTKRSGNGKGSRLRRSKEIQ